MFRGANGQKDQFRRNPNAPEVAHIKYIDTARGTKLMVSGWWGLARHINYTGDWMMGWAWCLSCGASAGAATAAAPPPGPPGLRRPLLVHKKTALDAHSNNESRAGPRAGYGSIVPYFYVIYFGVLLIHREMCGTRPLASVTDEPRAPHSLARLEHLVRLTMRAPPLLSLAGATRSRAGPSTARTGIATAPSSSTASSPESTRLHKIVRADT